MLRNKQWPRSKELPGTVVFRSSKPCVVGRKATKKSRKQLKEVIHLVVASGHVHVVIFLCGRCRLRCSKTAVQADRDSRHLTVLEWIMQHDAKFADSWCGLSKDYAKAGKRETLGDCILNEATAVAVRGTSSA